MLLRKRLPLFGQQFVFQFQHLRLIYLHIKLCSVEADEGLYERSFCLPRLKSCTDTNPKACKLNIKVFACILHVFICQFVGSYRQGLVAPRGAVLPADDGILSFV